MKRRTFISTLTALIAAPALPAGAAAPSSAITQHFARAKLLARCHDRASPEMFARLMKLDQNTAQGVYAMLKDRAVIERGADGITRALNPLNTNCVPNEARKAREFAKISSDISRKLREMAQRRRDALLEDMDEPPHEPTDSDTPHEVSEQPDPEVKTIG